MLALIAGQGDLPTRVASRAGKWPLIAAMDHCPPTELLPEISFSLETLGTLLQKLAAAGVFEVCFAGSITRPRLDPSKIDQATAPLVPRILEALKTGDDRALRTVIEVFETAGFKVRGADEFVPEFLAKAGPLGSLQVSKQDQMDIARAQDVINTIGDLDVGQACVVSQGQVLAIEAVGGTDWMLDSLQNRTERFPKGGLLVKAAKPKQDRRVDLPTIGVDTLDNLQRAGLHGVVVHHGQALIIDPEKVAKKATDMDLIVHIATWPS